VRQPTLIASAVVVLWCAPAGPLLAQGPASEHDTLSGTFSFGSSQGSLTVRRLN